MGHRGKDRTFSKVAMVDLNFFLLSNSHDRRHHLQAHLTCLQHWLEIFQSLGQQLLLLLYADEFLPHLRDL